MVGLGTPLAPDAVRVPAAPATSAIPPSSCSADSAGHMLTSIEDLGRAFRNRLAPAGVETGMHFLLRTLARIGPARVTEVAAEVRLDTSTVSRHVQNLERQGYVARTQDPLDGRAYRLELSPPGRSLLDTLHHDHVATLQDLIDGWTTDEVDELTGYLTRLVRDLHDHDAAGPRTPSSPRTHARTPSRRNLHEVTR